MTKMLIIMFSIMIFGLIAGIPMMIGMTSGALISVMAVFPELELEMAVQQLYVGVSSYVLLAVPMFMLAAEIMCAGECANRLLNLVRSLLGHLPGGVAVTSIGASTLFGSVSGSTQATFVAIGRPMHRELKKIGYDDSHSIAMLMNSANIALLIPPSISMIIYCVVANASIAELFIAGIGPGLLMFLVYSIYEVAYAKKHDMERAPRATLKEIGKAAKEAILPLGFPVVVLGGIYTGIFSPTEGAAVSVIYAFLLERFVYKTIKVKDLGKMLIGIGEITATVFVLVGAGQVLSWALSFGGAPQAMAKAVANLGLSANGFLLFVSAVLFVSCMFVDSIPVIYILVPIFYPIANTLGIDPIHLGIIVVLQAAIGTVTPPFGCNIFTAVAIFDMSFTDVVKKLGPYMAMSIILTLILVLFPDIALFMRNIAFG